MPRIPAGYSNVNEIHALKSADHIEFRPASAEQSARFSQRLFSRAGGRVGKRQNRHSFKRAVALVSADLSICLIPPANFALYWRAAVLFAFAPEGVTSAHAGFRNKSPHRAVAGGARF
jgi:hypothetical protein